MTKSTRYCLQKLSRKKLLQNVLPLCCTDAIYVVNSRLSCTIWAFSSIDTFCVTMWSVLQRFRDSVTIITYIFSNNNNNNNRESGAAADRASANKANKYSNLSNSHIFYPVAVETAGAWNRLAIELIQEIGKRASTITDDARETTFLFQRMSIAVQRGDATAFANTYSSLWYAVMVIVSLCLIFMPAALCWWAKK